MNDNCKPLVRAPRHAAPSPLLLKPRWKFSALAAALLACAGLYAPEASALSLGPITVQSALGEPLRAEIDLSQITPAEAESLRASTAAADVFRTQGMEYSSTVSQMRVQLHRRPDGRTVLRLSGNSPVNEPFVDLVIDARWSAGHVTRSYTMLFDPPSAQRSPSATAMAPALAAPENRSLPSAARRAAPMPSNAADKAGSSADDARSAAPARPERTAAPARNRAQADGAARETVQVRPGDTAGSIANARRPQGVSLDQMLVAMTRANPDAFIQGNVNRLKAGSVLQIPGQEEALTTPTGQARQLLAVQSRDFNDFRRRLAGAAPAAEQAPAQRTASGSVQTRIEDSSAPASTPDKLTLSKGAMQGQKTTEEMLAQRKQGNEAAARTQELAKNIEELNRLNAASGTATQIAGTTAAASATAPGLAVTNPGLVLPTDPSATAAPDAAETTAPVQAPSDATPAAQTDAAVAATTTPSDPNAAAPANPAVTPPPAPQALPEPAPESSGLVQDLLDQPALPLAGAALLLLLGYGAYRSVQRRRSQATVDSGFVDSRVHPDSFFGTSGGQRVDTTSASSTMGATSQLYSHSQLDTGGEVDPVAEADVYLAYGRDLQAEEILREAARHNPTRVPIFAKLGEIYAKRLDRKALEAVASDVHRLTQGQGAEWSQMVALGRTLDPNNTLYQPGGMPSANLAGLAAASAAGSRTGEPLDSMSTTVLQSRPMDLDLSLDFDLPDDALTEAPDEAAPSAFMPQAGSEIAHAQAQDWDALEDLVAFNAAIASPPKPSTETSGAARSPAASMLQQQDEALPELPAISPAPVPGMEPNHSHASTKTDANLGQDINLEWEELSIPSSAAMPEGGNSGEAFENDALEDFALNLELPDLDTNLQADSTTALSTSGTAQQAGAAKMAFVPSASGLMDFDFNDLSLDLESPKAAPDGTATAVGKADSTATEDPLNTKLSLAQEFHAIGDSEGARTLVEEVIAESSGTLKARARQLLAEMD